MSEPNPPTRADIDALEGVERVSDERVTPDPGEIVYVPWPLSGAGTSGVLYECPVTGWRVDERGRKSAILGEARRAKWAAEDLPPLGS